MTKLAIVGSSHVGAIRQAAPRVLAEYPGLQVGWFALPGAPFRRMQVDGDGVLQFEAANGAEKQTARRVNGDICLDLKGFDQVWVVGNRFEFGRIMRLFLEHDVLEWPSTGAKCTMSEAFGLRVLNTLIKRSCDRIKGRFGDDTRVVLTPGPYFSETALTEGVGFDKWMSALFVHPHAAKLEALFEATIRDQLAARGYGFLPQPAETRALRFATKAEYLSDARDFRDLDRKLADLHHMNADYGYALFKSFAELHLAKG